MTLTLAEIEVTLSQLEEKFDRLMVKVDQLINRESITSAHLEVIAAKIINEIQNEIQKCSSNQEIKDLLKDASTKAIVETHETKPFIGKYSYPNHSVGNEELGSSKNPKAMKWPSDFYKST